MNRKMRLVATIGLSISSLTLIPLDGSSTNDGIGALALPEGRLTWQAEGGQAGAHFGYAVASAGDVNGDGFADVIVGAPEYDVQGGDLDPEGRVSVYLGSALGFQPDAAWTAIGTRFFGSDVESAGDVNGDGFDDVLIPHFIGSSVYLGSSAGLTTNPLPVGPGYQLYSGASAGDVNGDGYDDIIMGGIAPNTFTQAAVFLFLGSSSGPASTAGWTLISNPRSSEAQVTGAGDVNGDGFDDVLIGFPYYEPPAFPGCTQGYALLVLGSPQGPGQVAWGQAGGANCQQFEFTHFGCSVAPAGDVNGDHFADFFVGCASGGDADTALYLGSASGQPTTTNWRIFFRNLVRGAGDVDGDGYDDVVVGIPTGSIPPIGSPFPRPEGYVSLYRGGPTGPSLTPDWTVRGGQDGGMFGFSVNGAGDTDGDGLANILVGAPVYESGPQEDEGMAFVFFGPPADLCGNGDRDRDGYCDSGPATDCEDGDPAIRPNAPELCNGRDDNCDGVVDEEVNVGTACSIVVDISISFQNAEGKGSGLITWRTIIEHDLIGFNVVLIDNMGTRVQQNLVIIPCEECQTDLGHAYSFIIPKHKSGRDLFIEQLHVDGRVETFGPAVHQ